MVRVVVCLFVCCPSLVNIALASKKLPGGILQIRLYMCITLASGSTKL